MKMIGWFSGGVTSAVSIKMALDAGHDVDIYYMETNSHHEDASRFLSDCEKWFGQKINILRNKKYLDAHDVCEKDKYINGPSGARCTKVLKKDIRIAIEKFIDYDYQIFGFDADEIERAVLFKQQYPAAKPVYPLLEQGWTKTMCLATIQDNGIEIPAMYKLGYSNANCVGCVKGGQGYWNKIRKDFPEVFDRMAKIERKIGASCLKKRVPKSGGGYKSVKLYLDELDPTAGRGESIALPECGVTCSVEFMGMTKNHDISEITTGLFSQKDLTK